MGFIRTKRIKGNDYAYLVENRWKKKTSRQKVKKYLGRVIEFHKKRSIDFRGFLGIIDLSEYIKEHPKEEIINDLIVFELFSCGFKKNDRLQWVCNDVKLDLGQKSISHKNKSCVIRINDGFLCNETMQNLVAFNLLGHSKEGALALARIFVDAGISIPKEVFVAFFNKINKNRVDALQ